MANVISKILDTQLLLALGMLLVFVSQAAFVPEAIKGAIGGFANIGALLIVVAAVLALWAKFKK